MVTRETPANRCFLFIEEWMTSLGYTDESLGARMGKSRTTIWRWRTEQSRLNPKKIGAIAAALGIAPENFWHSPRPGRPSLDNLLRDAPDELVKRAAEVATILLKTGS